MSEIDTAKSFVWELEAWPRFTWQKKIMPPILRDIHRLQGQLIGFSTVFPEADLNLIEFDAKVNRVAYRFETSDDPAFRLECQSAVAQEMGFKNKQINRRFPVSDRVKYQTLFELDLESLPDEDFNKFRLIQWYKWIKDSEMKVEDPNVPKLRSFELLPNAIPKDRLNKELNIFILWFNQTKTSLAIDPAIRAAITYLWLSLIRPFENYNQFLALRMAELAFTQTDGALGNFINLLAELENMDQQPMPQANLTQALNEAAIGELDITPWILWFLGAYKRSLTKAMERLNWHFQKEKFWLIHHSTDLNKDQISVIETLLTDRTDAYRWGVSASEYMKLTKVSKATATRHLADMVKKGCLKRRAAGGRSTRYQLLFQKEA